MNIDYVQKFYLNSVCRIFFERGKKITSILNEVWECCSGLGYSEGEKFKLFSSTFLPG